MKTELLLQSKIIICSAGLSLSLSISAGVAENIYVYRENSNYHNAVDLNLKPESFREWRDFPAVLESEYTDGFRFTSVANGLEIQFEILSVKEKTVKIGNGTEPAIKVETSGELEIPSTIVIEGFNYNVISIADSAFFNCNKLTSVQIPASILSSGKDAFYGCRSLKKLLVSDLSAWCAVAFSNIYSNPLYYARHLYETPSTEIIELKIPDDVNSIGANAFVQGSFKTVTIPGSVEIVGNASFNNNLSLTSVYMENGVGYVKNYAFSGCKALTSVTLPESLYRLGGSSFLGCTALESVVLPSGLTGTGTLEGIGDKAFSGCTSLKLVTSKVMSPSALGTESFASVASDCVLNIPAGTIMAYFKAGWTKEIFSGGVYEIGEVVENFCIENGVTHDFMRDVVYPDDDYSYTKITDYTTQSTSYRKDLPMPVRIEIPMTNDGDALIMEIYNRDVLARTDTFIVGQKGLEIWNLIPQTTYNYKLFVLDADDNKTEVASGRFTTEGQVRMMKIDNMANFRDIGGWKLQSGKRISYDKIFRSAELATSSQNITPEGIFELLEVQGLDVEIDFADEVYSAVSPISDYVEHVHGDEYQLTYYANGMKTGQAQYKNCFEKVVNSLRAGKKVLFHCMQGADRSGGFAFFLEGLLGVSESDLAKDYELTCFKYDTKYRSGDNYKGMVNYIKNTYEGNTLNEKIEQMALTNFGISQQDIDDFRKLMIQDSVTNPEILTPANVLMVQGVEVSPGKSIPLNIELRNDSTNLTEWQCDIELPEGLTLAMKANGKPAAMLGNRFITTEHAISSSILSNGAYRFTVTSPYGEVIPDTCGVLFTVILQADASLAGQASPGSAHTLAAKVTNIVFYTLDNQQLVLDDVTFEVTIPIPDTKKCATPNIVYNRGELLFECETEGATFVSNVYVADSKSSNGVRIELDQTYIITVHATLDGYNDSDVTTATIRWRNGRPVMEGFSSVTLEEDEMKADVNGDGEVGIGDIVAITNIMAGQAASRSE